MKLKFNFLLLFTLVALGACVEKDPSEDSDGDGVNDVADCDPANSELWADVSYSAVDIDLDGYRVNISGEICTNGNLPAEYFESSLADGVEPDCNDSDSTIWRNVTSYYDVDNDGVGAGVAYLACVGDTPEEGASFSSYDCAELDESKWRKAVVYQDIDGDGVGSGSRTISCIGSAPDTGYSFLGYDPLDDLSNSESASTFEVEIPSHILSTPATLADGDIP